MNVRIGIIGMGRVGSSLKEALCSAGFSDISVYSRSQGGDLNRLVSESDIIFISVSDDALEDIADRIDESSEKVTGKVFVHFSGLKTSAVFSELRKKGALAASFHPLQTFPDGNSGANFRNISFALEGDDVLEQLKGIFGRFGADIFIIKPHDKVIYHAAAVISSNLLCALLSISDSMLRETGIEEGVRFHRRLIQTTIMNVFEKNPAEALTGPASRGDTETVAAHISALSGRRREIYQKLTEEAADLAITGGKVEPENIKKLLKYLSGN